MRSSKMSKTQKKSFTLQCMHHVQDLAIFCGKPYQYWTFSSRDLVISDNQNNQITRKLSTIIGSIRKSILASSRLILLDHITYVIINLEGSSTIRRLLGWHLLPIWFSPGQVTPPSICEEWEGVDSLTCWWVQFIIITIPSCSTILWSSRSRWTECPGRTLVTGVVDSWAGAIWYHRGITW